MPDSTKPARKAGRGTTSRSGTTAKAAETARPGKTAKPAVPVDTVREAPAATSRPETEYVSRLEKTYDRFNDLEEMLDDPVSMEGLYDHLDIPEDGEALIEGKVMQFLMGDLFSTVDEAVRELQEKAESSPDTYLEECVDAARTLRRIREAGWIINNFGDTRAPDGEELSAAEHYERFLREWEERVCGPFYPLLFVTRFPVSLECDPADVSSLPRGRTPQDAFFHVCEDESKRVDPRPRELPVVIGVDVAGCPELLHVETGEAPVDWKAVFSGLRERGLKHLLFVFHGNLEGAPEGVAAVFPGARVFRSLRPMLEESAENLPRRERGKFPPAVANAFLSAPDSAAGLKRLSVLWQKKAPEAVAYWRNNLDAVDTVLTLPADLRPLVFSQDPREFVDSGFASHPQACPTPTLLLPYVLLRCEGALPGVRASGPVPRWFRMRDAIASLPWDLDITNRTPDDGD